MCACDRDSEVERFVDTDLVFGCASVVHRVQSCSRLAVVIRECAITRRGPTSRKFVQPKIYEDYVSVFFTDEASSLAPLYPVELRDGRFILCVFHVRCTECLLGTCTDFESA